MVTVFAVVFVASSVALLAAYFVLADLVEFAPAVGSR
ncbi:hypothetical protein DFQ14_11563 [Halopolyspora algeriensis]|uniref:Uncharacterized protein n=1 Tax=Halopolyspora algeriensis TaxID=1500506 RepID=A0A368VEK1_9ACTN|nr:hypothetical protein DFQ14_11563 [Halopolyspora algeriensis]TQM54020.1 hypothetical protein FHU43_2198 [Halopolyspora algeriensis]